MCNESFYLFRFTDIEWECIPNNRKISSEEHMNEYIDRCIRTGSIPFDSYEETFYSLNDVMKRLALFKEKHPVITKQSLKKHNNSGEWCAYCSIDYYSGNDTWETIESYAQEINTTY